MSQIRIPPKYFICHNSFPSFIEKIHTDLSQPIHRAGATQLIHPADEKIQVFPLFPFDEQLNLEIFTIELLPGCVHLSPPHQCGVIEHVIIIIGKIEVLANGHWQTLKKGEGLRFHANQPHRYRNLTTKPARFQDIIHYTHTGE